jgi:hypothetical protein
MPPKDKSKRGKRAAAKAAAENGGEVAEIVENTGKLEIDDESHVVHNENSRATTGVLTSSKDSRDIKVLQQLITEYFLFNNS